MRAKKKLKNMKNCRVKSDEKYMKIKFNSHDKLPLNRTIEIARTIIVVRTVFHEKNKYYPQFFLDECLYKFRHKRNKNIICETKNFYFLRAFLSITIALLVAVSIYCYLIK